LNRNRNLTDKQRALTVAVVTLMLARLVINMTRRFPYAFLPTISRQLGVPLSTVQNVMALQAGAGGASPIFGPISERYGRKRVVLGTLALMIAASVLGVANQDFQIFAGVMIAFGIVKMIFDPTIQAYLGDRIPYHRRGVAMGFVELSWAGSLLIAAPIAGILLGFSEPVFPAAAFQLDFLPDLFVTSNGLQAVFILLTLLSILTLIAILVLIPADHPSADNRLRLITPIDTLRIMRSNPAAIGAVGSTLLLSIANEIFFINYGAWLEDSFDLILAAIGTVTIAIAAAEVIGEVTVITIADRIGKRRLALISGFISSLCYVLIPFLDFSLPLAIAAIFVMFLFVEITIVAGIPLFSEILPESRAVMMSGVIGAASVGRLLGALIGGFILALTGSFVIMGIAATIIGLISWVMLWQLVPENEK
jgi:predicted MFS family arabinose efflux permease